MRIARILILLLCLAESCFGIRLIRDAEMESVLTDMARSVFKVAGLNEKSAKIFIIDSDEVNAFTIGNGYIFINSGLILRVSDHSQIFAVISHETAHIAAGHINRLMVTMQTRSANVTGAMLAGILGSVVTGSEKAMAAAMGYIMADERLFLKYTRGEEFAADALGASYLEQLGYGSECMISLLKMFQNLEILNGGEHVPTYVRSHPNPDDRITALKRHSGNKKIRFDTELAARYSRVLNKLRAYTKNREDATDDYSKAIYYHKRGMTNAAIALLESLVAENPHDVFYKETLAQCLYESGRINESIRLYRQIVGNNLLIRINYAEVLVEDGKHLDEAVRILETAKYEERFDPDIYRLLGKAYGKQNKLGKSYLMLAQEQIILGEYDVAEKFLVLSLKHLDEKSEKSDIKKAQYLQKLILEKRS